LGFHFSFSLGVISYQSELCSRFSSVFSSCDEEVGLFPPQLLSSAPVDRLSSHLGLSLVFLGLFLFQNPLYCEPTLEESFYLAETFFFFSGLCVVFFTLL